MVVSRPSSVCRGGKLISIRLESLLPGILTTLVVPIFILLVDVTVKIP